MSNETLKDYSMVDFSNVPPLKTTNVLMNQQFDKFMKNLDQMVKSFKNSNISDEKMRIILSNKLKTASDYIMNQLALDTRINIFDPREIYLTLIERLGNKTRDQIIKEEKSQDINDKSNHFIEILNELKNLLYKFINDTGLKLIGMFYDQEIFEEYFKNINIDYDQEIFEEYFKNINKDSAFGSFESFKQNLINTCLYRIDENDSKFLKKILPNNYFNMIKKEIIKTSLNFGTENTLLSFVYFNIIHQWILDGNYLILFTNNDTVKFIYRLVIFLREQINSYIVFISQLGGTGQFPDKKMVLDEYYRKFYKKYKQVFTHLKIRQEEDNGLYDLTISNKNVKICQSLRGGKERCHLFGEFDSIFNSSTNNKTISDRLINDTNILEQLKNNPICIIGLGQSGSGKTSTLIQLNNKGNISNGILLNIINSIKEEIDKSTEEEKKKEGKKEEGKKEGQQLQIELNIKEIKLNNNEYNNINSEEDFMSNIANNITIETKIDGTFNYIEELGNVITNQLDQENRVQFPTTNNIQSSRSHIIIKIGFPGTNYKNIYICDLAGVENEFPCDENEEIFKLLISLKESPLEMSKFENPKTKKNYFTPELIKFINDNVNSDAKKYINEIKHLNTTPPIKFNKRTFRGTVLDKLFYYSTGAVITGTNFREQMKKKMEEILETEVTNLEKTLQEFKESLVRYCNDRKREGYLINYTLRGLNHDIIKLVKFKEEKKPFFFDNIIDEGCRNAYPKINYFDIMSKNLNLSSNPGILFDQLEATERENIKMHIITVANNNISNKQKKNYQYDVNPLKYKKLQGTINEDDLLKLERMISNNAQTFLGSIENMQQLGNFMFNSISCIYSKNKPTDDPKYVKKYLKYKKKYLELKLKLSK